MPKKINNNTSLHVIKDISTIEELSKYDKLITRHGLALTSGNKYNAEEIKQTMYLLMHKYFQKHKGVTINGGLVSICMRNNLKDIFKKSNRLIPVGPSSELRLEKQYVEPEVEREDVFNILQMLDNVERKTLLEYTYNSVSELFRKEGNTLPYDTIRFKKKKFITQLKEKYNL